MMRHVLLGCVIAVSLVASEALAHHKEPGRMHPVVTTVRLSEPVLVGGKPLAPGTYEMVVTDERPATGSDLQRVVEFLLNKTVVATDVAEVFPFEERPVGTSGSASKPRAVVQRLKEDNFLRIAVNGADARYLVHLPLNPR